MRGHSTTVVWSSGGAGAEDEYGRDRCTGRAPRVPHPSLSKTSEQGPRDPGWDRPRETQRTVRTRNRPEDMGVPQIGLSVLKSVTGIGSGPFRGTTPWSFVPPGEPLSPSRGRSVCIRTPPVSPGAERPLERSPVTGGTTYSTSPTVSVLPSPETGSRVDVSGSGSGLPVPRVPGESRLIGHGTELERRAQWNWGRSSTPVDVV